MPASRPSWKGYLKLALVSCPVALWPATAPGERVSFRQVNKKTGNRIRYQSIDEGTREPVEPSDKGKGYEIDKDQYIMVEEDELKSIQIESTRAIEIDSFVPRADIDERYLESPYYLAPSEKVGAEAFAVIREAMRDKRMAALARVVLSSREHVIMLQPWDKGMLGITLRYPYELRPAADYLGDIPDVKIDPELLSLAQHILKGKSAEFSPELFVDRYEQAVIELLSAKQKGAPASIKRSTPAPLSTVDLMEALRRSLAQNSAPKPANDANATKATKATKSKAAKPRDTRQREMLLPISGKKAPAEEPARRETKTPARRKAG